MVNKRLTFLLVIPEQYQLSTGISSVLSRFTQTLEGLISKLM
jgi:hypothetical protein